MTDELVIDSTFNPPLIQEQSTPTPVPQVTPPPPVMQYPQFATSEGRTEFETGGQRAVGWWEGFGAAMDEASRRSPIGGVFGPSQELGSWARAYAESQIEEENKLRGVKKLTPNEANLMFPNMDIPFNKDIDPIIAQLHYDETIKRRNDQEWVERSGIGGFGQFLAGAVPTALDPINLGAGFLLSGGMALAKIAQTWKTLFASNVVGNLLADVPSALQRKSEQEPVSIPSEIVQSVAGATLGTGIHLGVSKILGAVFPKVREDVKTHPPILQEKAMATAVAQEEAGSRVDLSNIDKQIEITKSPEMSSKIPPDSVDAEKKFLDKTTEVSKWQDQEIEQKMKELSDKPNLNPPDIQKTVQTDYDVTMKQLKEFSEEDPELVAEIEAMNKQNVLTEQEIKTTEMLKDCFLRNSV